MNSHGGTKKAILVLLVISWVGMFTYIVGRFEQAPVFADAKELSVGLSVGQLIDALKQFPQDVPVVVLLGKGKKGAPIAPPAAAPMTTDQRRGWFDKHIDASATTVVVIQEAP